MPTVIHERLETELPAAQAGGGALWLNAAEIELTTGWAWKHEGLCRGEACVPLPAHGATAWVRGERLDLAAVWQHMGQPVVHDEAGHTWVLGTGAQQRADALAALEAPDFELPDLGGRTHRLSSLRGRRVFLATWASW